MNVIELLADLQAQHDETTARAGELRDQIEHLTAALAETEARLADLATTRKVIAHGALAEGIPPPMRCRPVGDVLGELRHRHQRELAW
ncbi:hypothetical protein [Streptomyces sp. NBC_01235]|uniref:hypothetical protein n=1 Tax=Streptomyces sp. NBC_01235 TaxID=2903788 RepID=UPI002E15756D|nr:hypothetical protein OG289_48870 [Streptomyces sp. NBC_01235]